MASISVIHVGASSPDEFSATQVASIASGSLTVGHRYLVLAQVSANPRDRGMIHEIRFNGVADPNLTLYHRNTYTSPSGGQSFLLMRVWTAVSGHDIQWWVTPYDPQSPYGYRFTEGKLIAIDLDTCGTENTDWWANENNTAKANLNTVYADNPGASITFTPDGSSDYLILGSGQFTEDNVNINSQNSQWMELYDSISGQLCQDGYGKSEANASGTAWAHNALWVLEAPSASSRTLTLRFKGSSGYTSLDYKHSCLWVFRLNLTKSYAVGVGTQGGTNLPATETTLESETFTPRNGLAMIFGRVAWYSQSTQTFGNNQRLRYDGTEIAATLREGCGPLNYGSWTTSPPGPPVGQFQMRYAGAGAGLVVDTPGTIALSYQPNAALAAQDVFEHALVMFDLDLDDTPIPVDLTLDPISTTSSLDDITLNVSSPPSEGEVPDYPREIFDQGATVQNRLALGATGNGTTNKLQIAGPHTFTLVSTPTIDDLGVPAGDTAGTVRLGMLPGDQILLTGDPLGPNHEKVYTLTDPNNLEVLEVIDEFDTDSAQYDFTAIRRK